MTTANVQNDQQLGPGLVNGGGGSSVPQLSSVFSKPTRHRKAASDTSWFNRPIGSIKDTLRLHKLNPAGATNSRHSAPRLDFRYDDAVENDTSRRFEPQKDDANHPRSIDDRSRLGDQLYAVLQNDATLNGRLFVPKNELDLVITQETVERELSRVVYFLARISPKTWRTATPLRISSSPERIDIFAKQRSSKTHVNESVQKIFAILLLIDRPRKIWSFLREGVCDANLPLRSVQGRLSTSSALEHLRSSAGYLTCLKKRRDISSFVDKQWMVHVPVFVQSSRKEICHVEVDDQQSLPFLHWEQSGHVGSFGEIYRAEIHPHHCKFSPDVVPKGVVAVKRLLVGNPKAFKHESTILQKLQREPHSHPHLITLLATFEQRKHQYLIFPWAQSDLKDYWMREDQVKDGSFSIWLVRQCQGLVEALSRIHRYETTSGTTIIYQRSDGLSTNKPVPAESRTHDPARSRGPLTLHGRHGDIKPQNILWYHNSATTQDFGTMKLADFGSARFGDATRMTEVKKKSMAISRTYLSPECQMPDGQPSIQCDIWALGCVFLEFICWYFTGHAGLKTFEDQRNVGYDSDSFFHIVRHGKTERSPQFDAILKETVIEKIAELRTLSELDKGLADLLDSIENNMLVVQSDGLINVQEVDGGENSMLQESLSVPPGPYRRMSSGNLARKLGDTLQLIETSGRNSNDAS